MRSLLRNFGTSISEVSALAVLAWALSGAATTAQEMDSGLIAAPCRPDCAVRHANTRGHRATGYGGKLGYGPPGLIPGFQGFGLGFHRGYGYGGDAFGPGAEGGYPFYGGPGYPHPAPRLRRLGRIQPYTYNAGPGSAAPENSIYFQEPGPLVVDPPIVSTNGAHYDAATASSYGPYTGAPPYPPTTFAPFSTPAADEAVPTSTSAPSLHHESEASPPRP